MNKFILALSLLFLSACVTTQTTTNCFDAMIKKGLRRSQALDACESVKQKEIKDGVKYKVTEDTKVIFGKKVYQ